VDRRQSTWAEEPNPSQKAALALELEKQLAREAKKRQREHAQTAPGRTGTLPEIFPEVSDKGEAREKAAHMLGANPHYITDAKKIERDAPEILEQVKQGTLSIPQAKKVAVLPVAERPAALERIHKKEPEEGSISFRDREAVSWRSEKEGSGTKNDSGKNSKVTPSDCSCGRAVVANLPQQEQGQAREQAPPQGRPLSALRSRGI
jgi:hypothetical protein